MVHAEIERFVELIVEDAISNVPKKIAGWKVAGHQSDLVDALVVYMDKELRGSLKKNNGVKSSDLLSLLKPLGITGTQLDNIWLQTMNTYGEVRGGLAHNTRRAVQPIDPQTEQNLVYRQILPELDRLEQLIRAIS